MSPSELSISQLGPESDSLLRNLFEHYIHDMAEWFEVDTKADGSYSFDTTPIWENRCDVYLAKVGDAVAGFALVGSAAKWLGEIRAYDMREFFVIRTYRRNGFGQKMATLLWNEYPGEWLIRVLELNVPAVQFWRIAVSSYSLDSYQEEQRVVSGRPWIFLRFVSKDA
jgi:predicted acetyltransferase